MTVDVDTAIFEDLFSIWEGAVELGWQKATRCKCLNVETKQASPSCTECYGSGVVYGEPVTTKALFRSQDRYVSRRMQGELAHGDAQLTTPLTVKPVYIDAKVRDRFTVTQASGDLETGRVFYPSAQPVPFIFTNIQRAWRTSVQAAEQQDRVIPQ